MEVVTRVNESVRASWRTSELAISPEKAVEYCSRYVTLEPGDVICISSPQPSLQVSGSDLVEIEVDGIGVLRNMIRKQATECIL
jgi:2-keto-4-pentenoate hydratase/2-oxohepta-3-ene-1,7-dioic acid hydratase in catechol pathway